MPRSQSRAFTSYGSGLLNALKNEVEISAVGESSQAKKKFPAIWDTGATATVITERVVRECGLIETDTGATATVITERVVRECGLIETGKTWIVGVNGEREKAPTYLVDVWLPHGVRVRSVTVAQMKLTGDEDILIGMDIIALGDFAVSSYQGITSFSFRTPSRQRIDFLPSKDRMKVTGQARITPKVGRNALCTCGSGRKFKNCCGK